MGYKTDVQASRSALQSVDTTLSADITATQNYIPVASTTNFSTSVVAEIESTNEVVSFDTITTQHLRYTDFTLAWILRRATKTLNAGTAPDGTNTATSIIPTIDNNNHRIDQTNLTLSESTEYTFSVYAKQNGYTGLSLTVQVPLNIVAIFDLNSGSVVSVSSGTANIQDVGNGWFRCSMTLTTPNPTSSNNVFIGVGSDSSTFSFVGNTTDGILIWSPQFEPSSNVTGFLPNETNSNNYQGLTTVTRGVNGTTAQAVSSGQTILQENLSVQSASYSTNPAWVLLDYLTSERYGKGLSINEINLQSFYDASQVCETQVTPYSGGSDINIFDINTALDTSKNIIENVRELLKGCRGYLPYNAGKYNLIIETTGTATVTLTEDDIIGGYSLSTPPKNERYNRVIVGFVDPSRNFQVNEIQWPPVDDSGLPSSDQHATMKAQDGGFLLEGRFNFTTLTNQYQAEEMAEVILRRSREALSLGLNINFNAYDLSIGEIVNITHSSMGFSAKPFRVIGITFNQDFTIGLSLVEHQDSHYTWATKTQAPTIPTTNLPNPFSILPPASLSLDDDLVEYSDGTVLTRLLINIGESTDQFVEDYEVEVKQTLDKNGNAVTEDYKLVGEGKSTQYQVLNVIDEATYSVRVRAINGLGVRSTFVTDTRKIIGATDTPQDVESFNISMVGSNQMQLQWKSVADLDIEFYEIRYSVGASPVEWFDTTNLVQVPRRKSNSVTINALKPPYHLYIKAVDKLGNESANPSIISSNVTRLDAFEDIATINEEPTFTGTYTNTFLGADNNNNPAVTLDTISLFDDRAGDFDDADSSGFFFDTGGIANNIQSSGNYLFNNTFTLDAIYDATFQVELTMQSDDPYDLFDSGRGALLFDNAKAPFDGNAPTNNTALISVGSSTTSLGDISSFTTVAQQGTFKGRYFKFKVDLSSLDNKAKPLVTGLQVKLVLEKRTETGDDVSSGLTTKTITFTNNFYQTPNISITGQDLDSGDYWVITNKSKTGFDIVFKNSSNTIIDKTFDYQAIGYGLQT